MELNTDTFRIAGGELGRTESYIDVNVVSITTSGEVSLEEVNGDGSWQVSLAKLREMEDDGHIVDGDDVPLPESGMWDALDVLTEVREGYSGRTGAELQGAQYRIFNAIIAENENESA